jgi:hypothetical protein
MPCNGFENCEDPLFRTLIGTTGSLAPTATTMGASLLLEGARHPATELTMALGAARE